MNPAGDLPDNQAFVAYTSRTSKFFVTVPEGGARTDAAGGVLFTDKYNSIRVETRSAVSAPTAASIRSSEMPTLSVLLGDDVPGSGRWPQAGRRAQWPPP